MYGLSSLRDKANCPYAFWSVTNPAEGLSVSPPQFLDQTETRRAEIIFLETVPPPYLRVWTHAPHPLPSSLKVWICQCCLYFQILFSYAYLNLQVQSFIEFFEDSCTDAIHWLSAYNYFPAMTEGWATYAEGILLPLNTNLYTEITDKQILLQKYGVVYYQVNMRLLLLTCFTLGSLRPPQTFYWLVNQSSGTRHKLLRGWLYSGCVSNKF